MSLLHVARHRPPPALVDTFLMARRHTVWPILNTAETGTWSWVGDAGKMYGGVYTNLSNALGDSFSLDNLNLFNAGLALNLLHTKASNGCTVSVYWGTKDEPTDLLGTFSTWAASTQKNVVEQIDLGTVPKGRETLHFVVSAAGAGGGHTMQIQQAEVVQLTGDNTGTSIDDLPWWVDVPPIAYSATNLTPTLSQSTGFTFGSRVQVAYNQFDYVEYDVDPPLGTNTLSVVHQQSGNRGIATFSLGGSDIGDIDFWGVSNNNALSTIPGIVNSASGNQKFRVRCDTKSNDFFYYLIMGWAQFRKTAAHGAITATGATYGRETAELWPWFADTKVGFNTFVLSASQLHYGIYWNSTAANGDYLEWSQALMAGSYSVEETIATFSNRGLSQLSLDGTPIDSVDHYSGSVAWNQRTSMSGSLAEGLLRITASDTGAGSDEYLSHTMIRAVRTGA